MNKLYLILFTIPLIGAGCLGNPEIDPTATVVDTKCEAWLDDATILNEGDRIIVRDLCYTAKAETTKNPEYCLLATGDAKADCLSLVASIANKPSICNELYPKDLEQFIPDCLTWVARTNENASACDAITSPMLKADCKDGAEACMVGHGGACEIMAGPFIGCDLVADKTVQGRCEKEYSSLAKYF